VDARRTVGLATSLGLALYAGFCFRDFLGEGLPILFDAHSHVARSAFVARAFEAGELPGWSNAWYGGFRLLEFHAPGYYALMGALALATGDVAQATKGVLWAGQVLSVLAFHTLLRRLTASWLLSLLGAVLLVRCVGRQMVLGVVGNQPSLLLYVAIPLYLDAVWRHAGAPRAQRLVAGTALLLGLMLLAHGANALLLLPGLLAFAGVRLWQQRRAAATGAGSVAARTLLPLVLAAGLAAFAFEPLLARRQLVSLALDHPQLVPFDPARALGILAGLSEPTWSAPFLWSLGAAWLALGALGAVACALRSPREARPFAAGLVVNLATVLVLDDRAAIGTLFFLAPLCVVTLESVRRGAALARLGRARALVPAFVLAVALVHPGAAPGRARYATGPEFEVYARIPGTPTPSRTFDVTPTSISLDAFYGPSSFSPVLSGRAVPFGGFPQAAPLASSVLLALGSRLVEDLRWPEPLLSEPSLDLLYLMHVGFLVDRGSAPALGALARRSGVGDAVEPGLLRLANASPALFAGRISLVRDRAPDTADVPRPPLLPLLEQQWERRPSRLHRHRSLDLLFRTGRERDYQVLTPFLEQMQIDRARSLAREILLADPLPPPPGSAPAGDARFQVLEHRETPRGVELLAEASRPGYVRLAYAHDPELRVTLDARPVPSVPDALGGAVVLAFPAGTHRIYLAAPEVGAAPELLLGLALLLALALALVLVVYRDSEQRAEAEGGSSP
jgi:hypothetical protein